jgi:SAM-dependent methyltransferase
LFVVILFSLLAPGLFAQQQSAAAEFVPHSGQAGKDVIWVPTPYELVDKMLELAQVTADDYVIDLGSGDGRTVIAAAKLGATAVGIEFNPDMVKLSEKSAKEAGVADKAKFIREDLFEADLSNATVITMFLLPDINRKLRPKLLDLKPGTRIVSNTFSMGEWEPDSEARTDNKNNSWSTALMWIIPAKVEGTWSLPKGELILQQEFQKIIGELKSGSGTESISEGRLTGDVIKFRAGKTIYTGKVNDNNTMSGTMMNGDEKGSWSATRKISATRTSIAQN